MNKRIDDAQQFIDDFKSKIEIGALDTTIILGVPHTHIHMASKQSDKCFNVSAQDCSRHESGAYTGEGVCIDDILEARSGLCYFGPF